MKKGRFATFFHLMLAKNMKISDVKCYQGLFTFTEDRYMEWQQAHAHEIR